MYECTFQDNVCFCYVHRDKTAEQCYVKEKRCFPHIDMVSVEVEFSYFQHTKEWFLSHGIEVQGHLNTIEEKKPIFENFTLRVVLAFCGPYAKNSWQCKPSSEQLYLCVHYLKTHWVGSLGGAKFSTLISSMHVWPRPALMCTVSHGLRQQSQVQLQRRSTLILSSQSVDQSASPCTSQ